MLDFLSMNGYGIYIWSTYGITLFVFGINLWSIYLEKKKLKQRILEMKQNESQS